MSKKEFTPPKSLATCADLLFQTRVERLELSKQVEELAKKEATLREHLINNLPKSDATGISGKFATARIEMKSVVQVTDWDAVYQFVIKNAKKGGFALLQRRISDSAVREIWEAHKEVPGCAAMNIPVVSLTKR